MAKFAFLRNLHEEAVILISHGGNAARIDTSDPSDPITFGKKSLFQGWAQRAPPKKTDQADLFFPEVGSHRTFETTSFAPYEN